MKKFKVLGISMLIAIVFTGCGASGKDSSSIRLNNHKYVFAEGMPNKFVEVSTIKTLKKEKEEDKSQDVVYPEINYDDNSVFVGGKIIR